MRSQKEYDDIPGTFVFDADRAGIVGILLVLGLGLLALLPVRPPATAAAPPA